MLALMLAGCESAGQYRRDIDRYAYNQVAAKQKQVLGQTEPFTIAEPPDLLRKRLIQQQDLLNTGPASLGVHELKPIPHWPDDDFLKTGSAPAGNSPIPATQPLQKTLPLSLLQALEVAARNSNDYQQQKEAVFRTALSLDLAQDFFRNTFDGLLSGLFSSDQGSHTTGITGSAQPSWTRTLKNGIKLTTAFAADLAQLLTANHASSLGLQGDASIEIPLLRGAGRWVVAEPLKQADRNLLYAVQRFERFKRTFAVSIASGYLAVLQQRDQIRTAEENYKDLIAAARRARRLADAGRLPEIQVDQAVQQELSARNNWVSAIESFGTRLDGFKQTLGLPTDARIQLDHNELQRLAKEVESRLPQVKTQDIAPGGKVPAADAKITLRPPDRANGGPMEIPEPRAIMLGLGHRLDLRIAEGQVYDAQRQVTVAANALLPELTFLGQASIGGRRGVGSAGEADTHLRPNQGQYSALVTLDLPWERTRERDAYRGSLIDLNDAVRNQQALEDQVKLDIRNDLRDLLEFRESFQIQTQAVALARKRVQATTQFLEAGRAEIRDVLDAQQSLVNAQNALTSALVRYRIAELALQRDMGLLQVNSRGLWQEYVPKEAGHGK